MKDRRFVIGVDGGGTKTVAALADLNGKILRKSLAGPSNAAKIGKELAVLNLGKAIMGLVGNLPKNRIGSIYIALAGSLERDNLLKSKIKKDLLKHFPSLNILTKKMTIDGDQKAAFRSGTNEKDGVLIIAGTGSIAMGWNGNKEAIAGGWDYILGDQGSAFWAGQEALKLVCRELDGRSSPISLLTRLILSRWGIKTEGALIKKVYQPNLVENIASLAQVVDAAAGKGDRKAQEILVRAGKELSLAALTVVKKLGFKKSRFPFVIIGGMFKSVFVMQTLKREIKRSAPGAQLILPRKEPVTGAVKLAIEHLET